MKLTKLWINGLKSVEHLEIEIPEVLVIIGENGRGKTAVLQALELLALGRVHGLPDNNAGVMRLAKSDRIDVGCWIEDDNGRALTVKRWWAREKNGSIKADSELTGFPKLAKNTPTNRAGQLEAVLGSLPKAWRPDDLMALTSPKLRRELLEFVPSELSEVAEYVPENCPAWARPERGAQAIEWIGVVIERTGADIRAEQKDRRNQVTTIGEVDYGVFTVHDIKEPQARLADAHAGRHAVMESGRMELQIARQKKALEGAAKPLSDARFIELRAKVAEIETEVATSREREKEAEEIRAQGFDLQNRATSLRGKAALLPDAPDQTVTEEDYDNADQAAAKLRDEVEDLSKQFHQAEAKAGVLAGECPLFECPECMAQLGTAWEAERNAAHETLRHLEQVLNATRLAFENTKTMAAELLQILDDTEDAKKAVALEAEAVALDAQLAELPDPPEVDPTIHTKLLDAERQIAESGRAEELRDDMQLTLDIAQAKLDDHQSAGTVAEWDEEIGEAERAIEEIAAANERLGIVSEAKDAIKHIDDRLVGLNGWLKQFRAIQATMLGGVKGWLEERIGAALGKEVCVQLFTDQGKPICRILVDGVDVSAISTGEDLRFNVGLVFAVAAASETPGWRPMLIDRFESVSKTYRVACLEAIKKTVDGGVVHQAIIAGCPDSVPEVSGVAVLRV